MIEYIAGEFTEKKPSYICVESCGLGYQVQVSLNTFSDVKDQFEGKLLTHYSVSVDVRSGESKHQLFGFSSNLERQIFRQLISISGISSSIAMMILSSFKASEFESIVISGDSKTLTAVKGIGPKVAQKIITELGGKFGKDEKFLDEPSNTGNSLRQEALSALNALGFDRAASVKVINAIMQKPDAPENVESLIKHALKQL
ncbi:MAG: Holliday junction branch migration protein RuvA [Salibacteraceae bacterium]